MTLAPLVLTSLLHLASAPSTCDQLLTCGEFDGRAIQTDANVNAVTVYEDVVIENVGPRTVRLTEYTTNAATRVTSWSVFEWTFADDDSFTVRELGRHHDDEMIGKGSCLKKRCTFRTLPSRALAAGAYTFDKDGFSYWIAEDRPGEGGFSTRLMRLSRTLKPTTPAPPVETNR